MYGAPGRVLKVVVFLLLGASAEQSSLRLIVRGRSVAVDLYGADGVDPDFSQYSDPGTKGENDLILTTLQPATAERAEQAVEEMRDRFEAH